MAHLRELNALWRYAHVVLAPHLDDAALSLGSSIASWTARKERTLVMTTCAGLPSPLEELSPLADAMTDGSAHAWMRARRREEEEALRILGADHWFGTALDAIFRDPSRYSRSAALFERPDLSDSLFAQTYGLVSVVASLARNARIYAPLGIGRHVDHQIVCAAALRAVPRDRGFFYEDVPYLFTQGAREDRIAELQGMGFDFQKAAQKPVRVNEIKFVAVSNYKTQLEPLFGSAPDAVRRTLSAQKDEPLWRVVLRSH